MTPMEMIAMANTALNIYLKLTKNAGMTKEERLANFEKQEAIFDPRDPSTLPTD